MAIAPATSLNLVIGGQTADIAAVRPEAAVKAAADKAQADKAQADKLQADKELSKEELIRVTDTMNDFMQMVNTDIRFSLHDKTKQLMVQVIDTKDQRVLREFPPHELLDTIAAIREYVGVLLDKKA